MNIFMKRKNKDVPQDEPKWYEEHGLFGGGVWLEKKNQTKPLLQMPASNLIKFAFSFRANAIRITLSAEATKDGRCLVIIDNSREGCKQREKKPDFMKQLEEIMKKHSLYKWAGFSESSPDHQFICESFFMKTVFKNGTRINAEGSSSFPDGFWEPTREIYKLFGLNI